MNNTLPTKELIIAVIEKDNSTLMRKKPAGSLPYKETWYSFGCEEIVGQDNQITTKDYLKKEIGIDVKISPQSIPSASEIKTDHDGVEKNFIYSYLICEYLDGEPQVPNGAEKVEWIPKNKLSEYDIVPPSVDLFRVLGYMSK